MANPNKHRAYIYVFYKNMPYSDEEWERTNQWREKLRQDNPWYAARRPEAWKPLKHRPVHPIKRDSAATQEQARKLCEKALEQGAQMAGYSVYTGGIGSKAVRESWAIRRGGDWYQTR